MNHIDIRRCIRGVFEDADSLTPEQVEFATSLIVDGPPNNRHVVLRTNAEPVAWGKETQTLTRTRDGVALRLKVLDDSRWTGVQGPINLTTAH